MIINVLLWFWVFVSSYIIVNLYNKVRIHEQWKDSLQDTLVRVLNGMREIDSRGLFENDDYTGAMFKDLAAVVEEVSSYTDTPSNLIESKLVE